MENLFDLLKPEGTLLMVFPVKCPIYDIYETLSSLENYERYMKDWRSFISPYHHKPSPIGFFHSLAHSAGFQIRHCEIRDQQFVYENIHQLRSELIERAGIKSSLRMS